MENVEKRLTDRSKKVLQLANQEALRFNHESVSDGHLLLGLVKEGSGIAAAVLKSFGVTLQSARAAFGKVEPEGPDMTTMGMLPRTECAKEAINEAARHAERLGHDYVGTEHLLLACIGSNSSAVEILRLLGLTENMGRSRIRAEVMSLLGLSPDGTPKEVATESECCPSWHYTITSIQTEFPVPPDVKVSEAKVLRLQPGDVLHVKVPERMSVQQMLSLQDSVRQQLPKGTNVIVSSGGTEMEVIRQDGGIEHKGFSPSELRDMLGMDKADPGGDWTATMKWNDEPAGIIESIELHGMSIVDKPDPGAAFRAAVSSAVLAKLDREICGELQPVAMQSVENAVLPELKTGPIGPVCPDCKDTRQYTPFNGPAVPCPTCCGE